jgi:hypothetical protein
MRVPDTITQCVGFLGAPSADDPEEIVVRGTVFFVSVPSEMRPESRRYEHLVTAHHCLNRVGALPLSVRLNAFTATADRVATDIPIGDALDWFTHPTDGEQDALPVDVAVLPWKADHTAFEYRCVPVDLLLTDEMSAGADEDGTHIGLGDEVCIPALFTRGTGRRLNLPSVRMGALALMPTEPVRTRSGAVEIDMEAYLIEARSLGGLSGAPVFVRAAMDGGVSREMQLLGLMHGHWDPPPGAIHDAVTDAAMTGEETGKEKAEAVTRGIGLVVPAKKIREALFQAELVDLRARHDRAVERKRLATRDAGADKAGT